MQPTADYQTHIINPLLTWFHPFVIVIVVTGPGVPAGLTTVSIMLN